MAGGRGLLTTYARGRMKDRDEMAEGGSSDSDAYRLSHSEARRRSLAGVLYMTSSSVASLVVGFLANLVLARLLLPSQFGVVAIGSTAMLIAGALADGGLGAGMVRLRSHRRSRS